MNWDKLIGSDIVVDGIEMTVTDVCKSCRRIHAKDAHYFYHVKVDRYENKSISSKKLKPLE